MDLIKVSSALISVYDKTGLDVLIRELAAHDVAIYSTGGTYDYITAMGVPAIKVEDLTGYPSMLDGRVKTLHPAVFGGILARRNEDHLGQLKHHQLPVIDLVAVDLYPFEETLKNTTDDHAIIDKIDIGGVSLLRAAAKNHHSVVVISRQSQYPVVAQWLNANQGATTLEQRTLLGYESFAVTAHYDTAISRYFAHKAGRQQVLRYGENPHQKAFFTGDYNQVFTQLAGKEISYNNIVDIDGAIALMSEFKDSKPAFAIIKHTNPCGVALRDTVKEAWDAALACDPTSAFGGIIICNKAIDAETASAIDDIFYEVLIAPGYEAGVVDMLKKKKNRILLTLHSFKPAVEQQKSMLGGTLVQDADFAPVENETLNQVTKKGIPAEKRADLIFGIKCVKHLKSNAIAIVKDLQMIGAGVGQTSRIDALRQAIDKAGRMGFTMDGSVLASDAFFPFADSVEIAYKAGIHYIVQPGGSVRDEDSVTYCDEHGLGMYFTGTRHFKH